MFSRSEALFVRELVTFLSEVEMDGMRIVGVVSRGGRGRSGSV